LLSFTFSFDDVIVSTFVSTAGTTTLPVYVFSALRVGLKGDLAAIPTLTLLLTLGTVAGRGPGARAGQPPLPGGGRAGAVGGARGRRRRLPRRRRGVRVVAGHDPLRAQPRAAAGRRRARGPPRGGGRGGGAGTR